MNALDKIEGFLEIGANDAGEVVINLDKDRTGHIKFSPNQARNLAAILITKANEIDAGPLDWRVEPEIADSKTPLGVTLIMGAMSVGGMDETLAREIVFNHYNSLLSAAAIFRDRLIRVEPCTRCGSLVSDWVDTDESHGRICRPCEELSYSKANVPFDELDPRIQIEKLPEDGRYGYSIEGLGAGVAETWREAYALGHGLLDRQALEIEVARLTRFEVQARAEQSHLLDLYTQTAAALGMNEYEDFDSLPALARTCLWELNAVIRFAIDVFLALDPNYRERLADLDWHVFDFVTSKWSAIPAGSQTLLTLAFIARMERELHANQHKGNWPEWVPNIEGARTELSHHFQKLHSQLRCDESEERARFISEFSADLANIAMKIYGTFGYKQPVAPPAALMLAETETPPAES